MNDVSPRSNKEVSPWHIERSTEPVEAEYTSYPRQTQSVNLLNYWNVVVKRRRLVAILFFVVFGTTAYINFSATPLYTASAMLQIEPQNPAVTGLAEILSSKSEGSGQYDYYQTQFILLRSRTLAARVISSLQLESDPAFHVRTVTGDVKSRLMPWLYLPLEPIIKLGDMLFPKKAPQKGGVSVPSEKANEPSISPYAVMRYLDFLQITPLQKTRLVEVSFSTPDPRLSQKLANAHAAGFIRLNLDNRSALTDEARDFLDKKNAELRTKLERAEEALNRFRQTHGVVSLEKGENIVVDRLVALNVQLTAARAQRIDAEALYRTVANKDYQDLSQVMTQGSIPQLKSNLAALEAERAKLSTIFKPDHPRLQEINDHINSARRSISAEITNVVRGIQSNFVAARAKEQALEAEAKMQEQKALDLKHISVEYAVLQEDVSVNRSLYESVLKRLSETNVTNDLAISNIQITQRAELPLYPSSPKTTQNLMMGLVAGLLIGLGAAFLLDYFDTRIKTPEHVEKAVALNTLGVVPDLNGINRFELEWNQSNRSVVSRLKSLAPGRLKLPPPATPSEMLITKQHPQSIFPESYRSIRTSLLFSRPERPPQVIVLTSAAPGEGKTGTSLNLAIALAQDGYRVLIIDADLRKGCCHERLGLANHKGLSNILTGNLSLEDGVQSTAIKGLSLISCGICPPSPADLLGSSKMREVLTRLRQHYQFIIVDTPPAIALADAPILSSMSDGVILVFHGHKTTTASAKQLITRLDGVNAPILGVILNSVDLKNPEFAYYGTYRSYYSANENHAVNGEDNKGGLASNQVQNSDSSNHQNGSLISESLREDQTIARQPIGNGESVPQPKNGNKIVKENRHISVDAAMFEVVKENSLTESSTVELIPRESLDRLIATVTKSIGPTAPIVVHEQIRTLGESYSAFPKSRIDELIKLLQREISKRTNPS